MSRARHTGKHKITVTFPIALLTRTGDRPAPDDANLPTQDEVRKLDGYVFDKEEDRFDQYVESCCLAEDEEITGGLLRLEYRPAQKQLWAILEFDAPRRLSADEKDELRDEIDGHRIWESLRQQHDLMFLDWRTEQLAIKQT